MLDPTLAVLRIASRTDIGLMLRRTVSRLLKEGRRNIVLVLHHDGLVSYEDIHCLASLGRGIRRAGGELSLVLMRADLRFIFRLLGVYDEFNVIERVEDIPHVSRRA